MNDTRRLDPPRASEAGFALILAILALLLLTFLGLTLAATTSTELQIATNYRWSRQAYYNAEAGIEVGKIVLRNIPTDWANVLPAARLTPEWDFGGASPNGGTAPSAAATRNWENKACDVMTGSGHGVVLDDSLAAVQPLLLSQSPHGPYENVTAFPGSTGSKVNGSFTLWVKRDLILNSATGKYHDDPANNSLILIAEGAAPNAAATSSSGVVLQWRSIRILQVKLSRGSTTSGSCEAAQGQEGTAASGANFGACAPLNSGGVTALGTGLTDTAVK